MHMVVRQTWIPPTSTSKPVCNCSKASCPVPTRTTLLLLSPKTFIPRPTRPPESEPRRLPNGAHRPRPAAHPLSLRLLRGRSRTGIVASMSSIRRLRPRPRPPKPRLRLTRRLKPRRKLRLPTDSTIAIRSGPRLSFSSRAHDRTPVGYSPKRFAHKRRPVPRRLRWSDPVCTPRPMVSPNLPTLPLLRRTSVPRAPPVRSTLPLAVPFLPLRSGLPRPWAPLLVLAPVVLCPLINAHSLRPPKSARSAMRDRPLRALPTPTSSITTAPACLSRRLAALASRAAHPHRRRRWLRPKRPLVNARIARLRP